MAAGISMCSGVDSASKNEYQVIPGGKGGPWVRVTTLPPSCAECLVIWSLNRPEPSGPHRPVIGIKKIINVNFNFMCKETIKSFGSRTMNSLDRNDKAEIHITRNLKVEVTKCITRMVKCTRKRSRFGTKWKIHFEIHLVSND